MFGCWSGARTCASRRNRPSLAPSSAKEPDRGDRNFDRGSGGCLSKSCPCGWEPRGLRGENHARESSVALLVSSEESSRISRQTSIGETAASSHQADGIVGERGGARPPLALLLRCSRIFLMTRGSVMKATTPRVPPHGHRSGSSSKTRRIKSAHRRRKACFEGGFRSARAPRFRFERNR